MQKRKITITQAFALLSALGAPVAEIVPDDKGGDAEYSQDEAISAIDESRTPILEPKIRESLTDQIQTAVSGKSAGVVRTILARLTGVGRADLEGLSQEEAIQKALEHHTSNSSKSTEDLRKQITDLSAAHTKALEDKDADWGKKVKEATDKYTERDIDAALMGVVNKIPRTGGDAAAQARQLKAVLRDKYHIHYDEARNEVQLRKKDSPESPALNDAGTLPLSIADSATAFLKDMGVAASDTRSKNPFDTIKEGENVTKLTGAEDGSVEAQAENVMALFEQG
ncbi:MAG: hypothetical protein EOP52_13460 [Sphingobacteriales bacterium]|nr:MAG: hypothetical protein EOP52_13460 [Sphingobacteriales bacterium]